MRKDFSFDSPVTKLDTPGSESRCVVEIRNNNKKIKKNSYYSMMFLNDVTVTCRSVVFIHPVERRSWPEFFFYDGVMSSNKKLNIKKSNILTYER
jgi:hypothetical protein